MLKKSKNKSAPGQDTITYKVIKCCSPKFMTLLLDIFNSCWYNGYFPRIWKQGNIITIPKTNTPKIPKDYRPITLLSCFGKLMERMINLRLSNFLERHKILPMDQCGFRPKLSSDMQLLRLTQTIHDSWSRKQVYTSAFVDVRKAFDTVWREGLLFKLADYGVPNKLFAVILPQRPNSVS